MKSRSPQGSGAVLAALLRPNGECTPSIVERNTSGRLRRSRADGESMRRWRSANGPGRRTEGPGLERDAPRHAVAEERVRTAEGVGMRRADHELARAVARPGAAHEREVEILRGVGAQETARQRHRISSFGASRVTDRAGSSSSTGMLDRPDASAGAGGEISWRRIAAAALASTARRSSRRLRARVRCAPETAVASPDLERHGHPVRAFRRARRRRGSPRTRRRTFCITSACWRSKCGWASWRISGDLPAPSARGDAGDRREAEIGRRGVLEGAREGLQVLGVSPRLLAGHEERRAGRPPKSAAST